MEGTRESTENGERVRERMTRRNVQVERKTVAGIWFQGECSPSQSCEYFLRHLYPLNFLLL